MYTVGDFLTRIKNGYMARKKNVRAPFAKASEALGKILKEEGYIKDIRVLEEDNKKYLEVELLYKNRRPSLNGVKLFSTPAAHVYVNKLGLRKGLNEFGLTIVSTSKGVMTGRQAHEKKLGGELICKVF